MSALLSMRPMAIDKEKQRARWKRNKRAERARKKPLRKVPHELSPDFISAVEKERERRLNVDCGGADVFRSSFYYEDGTWEKAIGFAADVWAVTTILEAKWGPGSATIAAVHAELEASGRMHGYTSQSLRKMIYKARERITILETTGLPWMHGEPFWPPFPEIRNS